MPVNANAVPISLRPVRMEDAALLLAWRNDPFTRQASHETAEVDPQTHHAWLARVLTDSSRRLWIAECNGVAVGQVRVDSMDEGQRLSWTVAPAARGQGVGTAMVRTVLEGLTGPVRAEVKATNPASARIAENAGLRLLGENQGILLYGCELT